MVQTPALSESAVATMIIQQHDVMVERYEKLELQLLEREKRIEEKVEKRIQQQHERESKIREEMEAKMDALRAEAKPTMATDAIKSEQLTALQSRLQALAAASLLSEEETYKLEDAIVDCIETMPTASAADATVNKVTRMIVISEKVAADASFARALRRKFCS